MIPPGGRRAAHILLDAVVSQDSDQNLDANVDAMTVALSFLSEGNSAHDNSPDPGDVIGAAVVCVAWLANQAAVASGQELEGIISFLRDFIDDNTPTNP